MATLGLHLLLAWGWRAAHPPAQETFEERIFNLIPIPPPAPERAFARRKLEPVRSIAPRRRMPGLPDAVREPEPLKPEHDGAAPVTEPIAIAAPAPSPLDTMAGRARRDAGAIDRELRKGKSGVPAEADTPGGRLVRALEGAYIDTSRTVVSETYTAPDGEIIYRFRQGSRVYCRISGGVKPGIGNAIGSGAAAFDVQGGGGSAGLIRCPSHGEWKRD